MPNILIDHRESRSEIVELLTRDDRFDLHFSTLPAGDYIINDEICIERKRSDDFIQSIITARIFDQCAKLKRLPYRVLILVDGNPFNTKHDIRPQSIRGAILSISTAWEIPVIICESCSETVDYIALSANQTTKNNIFVRRKGYKPKRVRSQQLNFIEGLPGVGIGLAKSLLEDFESIRVLVNSPYKELIKVPGIGKKKARGIEEFVTKSFV